MLSQINQSQKRTHEQQPKNPHCTTRVSSVAEFTEAENRTEGTGRSWDNGESLFNGYRIPALQDEKISGDRLCNCQCT